MVKISFNSRFLITANGFSHSLEDFAERNVVYTVGCRRQVGLCTRALLKTCSRLTPSQVEAEREAQNLCRLENRPTFWNTSALRPPVQDASSSRRLSRPLSSVETTKKIFHSELELRHVFVTRSASRIRRNKSKTLLASAEALFLIREIFLSCTFCFYRLHAHKDVSGEMNYCNSSTIVESGWGCDRNEAIDLLLQSMNDWNAS